MKALAIITFLAIFNSHFAYSQSNKTIKVQFSSAFLGPSDLTISEKGDSSTLQINYSGWDDKGSENISIKENENIQLLNEFLSTYQQSPFRDGLDGIDVTITVITNKMQQKFHFWSPENNTSDAKFEELAYQLMISTFKSRSAINYLELMEGYMSFDHGMPIKKISDKPLTYKLYGMLYSKYLDEFKKLLNSFPEDKDVFIDVSNLKLLTREFYPFINGEINTRPHLFWLHPTSAALKQLHEAGVSDVKIISTY